MTFRELLARLKKVAEGQEIHLYLVGGCVRDGLLGRPLADVDLAVEGDALAFAKRLASSLGGAFVPLGERHGTGRAVLPKAPDGVQHIDCTPFAGDIHQDLSRRDYTVDAMAVSLAAFEGHWSHAAVVDPYGGRQDLESGLLRMVSPQVLEADPVRLIRGVRLEAELGLRLEEQTTEALKERAQLLTTAAPERLRDELCRIVAAEGAATWVERLEELGLLDALLPELAQGRGVAQPKEHFWDVFRHQVETVAAVEALVERRVSPKLGPRPYLQVVGMASPWHARLEGYFDQQVGELSRETLLRLAALLHDVAKPATKTFEPSGRMRFFGHSELGAEMVEGILTRLRFSHQQVRMVAQMVASHLRPGQWSDGPLPTPRALYRYFRDVGEVAIDTIFLNLGDHLAARGPAIDLRHWRQHVETTSQVLTLYFEQRERIGQPRLLTGHDLMETFGLAPGPFIGRLLAEVEEARGAGALETREEALALVVDALSKARE